MFNRILSECLPLDEDFSLLNEDANKEKEVVERTITEVFKATKNKSFKNPKYKEIAVTTGDITKLANYMDIYNAINFLIKASNQTNSKELIEVISNLALCRDNIVKNKAGFTNGFTNKNSLIIMLYTNIVCALIYSISQVISKTITIVKDSYNVPVRKMDDSRVNEITEGSLYQSILMFNDMHKKGQLNTLFKDQRERLNESTFLYNEDGGATATLDIFGRLVDKSNILKFFAKHKKATLYITIAVAVIALAVFISQNIVYWITCARLHISLTLQQIALYNEIEAEKVNDAKTKKKLEEKAERLRKISEKLDIDGEVAEKRKKYEEEKDAKEISKKIKNDTNASDVNDNSDSSSDNDDILY